jgi:hypothetical protein
MEAYDDYLKMFDFFNIGTVITFSVILIVVYIGISIIKHNMLVGTIKKAVKSAIKELNEEETKKLNQPQPTDSIENNIQK